MTYIAMVFGAAFLSTLFFWWKQRELLKTQKEYIDELEEALSYDQNEVREQFLKFVSESRDWAYYYIETVQEKIADTCTFMESMIQSINKKKRKSAEDRVFLDVHRRLMELLPEDK